MQDFRLALQALRRTPVVTAVAILSLALGIGASTAIFSLINSVVLRTLPVAEPARLAHVSTGTASTQKAYSYATYDQIQQRRLFSGVMASSASLLTIDEESPNVVSQWVTGEYFSTLGVRAFAGRTLGPADDVVGGGPDGPATMISYRLWQRRFHGAADAIGETLLIERTPVTIVGVTPPEFQGVEVGQAFDLFLPVSINSIIRPSIPYDEHTPWLQILVRLQPNQTLEAGAAALQAAQQDIRVAAVPPRTSTAEFLKEPFVLDLADRGTSSLREQYQRSLWTLLALSMLVLLVACANLANLFLGRAAARRPEFSLRRALGASRGRLIRLLLAESAVVAAIGAALGLLFARWASQFLVTQLSTSDQPITLDLWLDWRVLLFTTVTAAATAIGVVLAPALRASEASPMEALRSEGRGTTGSASHYILNVLLVGQVAVSLMLVVATGLLVRTAQQLTRVPLGFDASRVLTLTVTAPTVAAENRNLFYHRLVEAVAAIPGVANAGGSLDAPLTRFLPGTPISVANARTLPDAERVSQLLSITPGWLGAYGMAIRTGRDIAASDGQGALPVMLVNETFAQRFFPEKNLVGQTLTMTAEVPPIGRISLGAKTVIGIVGDAVYSSIRGPSPPTIYTPLAQRDGPVRLSVFFMAVRPSIASPADVAQTVATTLRSIDPDLRLTLRPAVDQVNALLAQDRLVAKLSAFAGAFALLLATLGLYGVTAYAVWQRRGEIGIRLALGSTPGLAIRLIISRVLGLVLAGVVVGSLLALWASTYIAPLLYGVRPYDPLTFVAAAIVLGATGLLAASLPARRASRIDPAQILRG